MKLLKDCKAQAAFETILIIALAVLMAASISWVVKSSASSAASNLEGN